MHDREELWQVTSTILLYLEPSRLLLRQKVRSMVSQCVPRPDLRVLAGDRCNGLQIWRQIRPGWALPVRLLGSLQDRLKDRAIIANLSETVTRQREVQYSQSVRFGGDVGDKLVRKRLYLRRVRHSKLCRLLSHRWWKGREGVPVGDRAEVAGLEPQALCIDSSSSLCCDLYRAGTRGLRIAMASMKLTMASAIETGEVGRALPSTALGLKISDHTFARRRATP